MLESICTVFDAYLRLGPVLLPDGQNQLSGGEDAGLLAVVEANLLAVHVEDHSPLISSHLKGRQLGKEMQSLGMSYVPENDAAIFEVENVAFLPVVFFMCRRGTRNGDMNHFGEVQ